MNLNTSVEALENFKKIINHSLFKEFSLFGSSTVAQEGARVLVELAAAKILGPSIWGIWYLLNLGLTYGGIFHLGITNGMNREIPINLGKGNERKAQNLQDISFSQVLISTLLAGIVLVIISGFIKDQVFRNALLWLIPLLLTNQFDALLNSSLKANTLFNLVSKKQFAFSVLFPLFSIPLTYYLGLNGFIIGFTGASSISALLIYIYSPISYSFNYELAEIKKLIRIGFPIMAVGKSYKFLTTVDRWIIGIFLSTQELGYYSMAIMVYGAMTIFQQIIGQQFYPRMAYNWGKLKSYKSLNEWSKKQIKYTLYLNAPMLLVVFFIFPLLINIFLPGYAIGITPLRIILIGVVFMPLSAGWGNVLNIIDKQDLYLGVIILAIILNLVINYYLVIYGYGIDGVAFGTAVTFAVYNIAIMVTGKICIKKI